MHHWQFWIALSIPVLLVGDLSAQSKNIAERLGYAADSKLLIIHADDLAVAHSVDSASFDALEKSAVTSGSILVPCPWITEVADYSKAHPDADLGLHLTLTSEWKTYRWGPVESKDKVASLLDPTGTLWSQTALAATNVKPEEAEREIRAQIEYALALGIHPTHLDSHMGSLFSTPALITAYIKVAHEYHLPFLALRIPRCGSICTFRQGCGARCHSDRQPQSSPRTVEGFLSKRDQGAESRPHGNDCSPGPRRR